MVSGSPGSPPKGTVDAEQEQKVEEKEEEDVSSKILSLWMSTNVQLPGINAHAFVLSGQSTDS